MIASLKKYTVSICGQDYSLISDEMEEHIIASAFLVDKMMREISAESNYDIKRAAILASLKIACQLKNLESALELKHRQHMKLIDSIDNGLL